MIERFALLNENGIGGLIGHLRRMQAECFADADRADNPNTRAHAFGMSDAWGDLAERSEAVVQEWMIERQRHA